jgi:voltage-gated sodium channel
MTLDDWANIVKPAMELQPYALVFFMPFIVVSTFVVLNLFIGVIVESIQTLREDRGAGEAAAEAAEKSAERSDLRALVQEVRALRAEIATLRGQPKSNP